MGFTWYCSIILRVFDYWDYFQEVVENTTEGDSFRGNRAIKMVSLSSPTKSPLPLTACFFHTAQVFS